MVSKTRVVTKTRRHDCYYITQIKTAGL